MTAVNTLSDIVDNGLCVGCGVCQSIAGKDKIEVMMSPKGRLEPKEINKISPDIFEKIKSICPGTICLLYTSPSPRDATLSRMPSSA